MKKILYIFILLLFIDLGANGQVKRELGIMAGTSVKGLCQIDTRVDFGWSFEVSPNLFLGVGTGLRYSRPIDFDTVKDDLKTEKSYVNGLALPLFGRIRYSFSDKILFQTDAGYQQGLVSLLAGEGSFVIGPGSRGLTGFFAEPQAGYSFAPGKTVSIGLSLQERRYQHNIQTGTSGSDNYSVSSSTVHTPDAVAFVRLSIDL